MFFFFDRLGCMLQAAGAAPSRWTGRSGGESVCASKSRKSPLRAVLFQKTSRCPQDALCALNNNTLVMERRAGKDKPRRQKERVEEEPEACRAA